MYGFLSLPGNNSAEKHELQVIKPSKNNGIQLELTKISFVNKPRFHLKGK